MVPPVGLEPTHSLRSERSDFIQFAHGGIINTLLIDHRPVRHTGFEPVNLLLPEQAGTA